MPEPVPPPVPADAPPVQLASAKPRTASELPQTLIGTWSTLETWLPVRMPELKPVLQLPPAPPSVAEAPPTQLASANPSKLTALPQTLSGTCTTLETWLPVRTPALGPLVQPEPVPFAPAPAPAPCALPCSLYAPYD